MFDVNFVSLLMELVEAAKILVTAYPRLALGILVLAVVSVLTRKR